MKNTFSKLFLLVAIVAATVTFTNAQNQPKQDATPPAKCNHDMKQGQGACCPKTSCDIPDLTADQKTKMEDLTLQHIKAVTPLKNQLKEKQAKINSLLDVEKPDMVAINAAIDEMTVVTNQLIKKKAEHKLAIRNLLTDKQKIVFDAKSDLFDGMGCCMGGGPGKGGNDKCEKGQGYHQDEQNCPHHK